MLNNNIWLQKKNHKIMLKYIIFIINTPKLKNNKNQADTLGWIYMYTVKKCSTALERLQQIANRYHSLIC